MKVVLPDKSELELPEGATGGDAASAIGEGLARAALAVQVNGETRDLARPLEDGQQIEIVTTDNSEALEIIRHDAAHVMATAVTEIWPGTKVSIGPPIADGFYYDFDFPEGTKVSDANFEEIEDRMRYHIDRDEPFQRSEVSVDEAVARFSSAGQDYKIELIEDLVRDESVDTVTLYQNGSFVDLCRGPHSPSTGRIKAYKLLSIAGAYWRGDERNKMLTRIYGTAFFSRRDLEGYLERIERARARDHRRLGRRLGLFLTREEAPGMPFFLPKGVRLWEKIESAVRGQLDKRGYVEIRTPHILDEQLWHRSGHYENYVEHMYFTEAEERRFAVKPMNCPGACLVYESEPRSYRDLPLKLAEFGLCSRREREGVLHGLMRVRAFVQDDAHVFCTPDQVVDEVRDICEAIDELYATFGFDEVRVELSTRPERSIGSDKDWEQAEADLHEALEGMGREYKLNPGDGAFYGPKIDFHITDALGRSWQCGTCQLDFFMPERFGLTYAGSDNVEHRPVMIHRALIGSMERFIGVLIEHFGGDFPLWLAPLQVVVLAVADRHAEYAEEVESELERAGLQVEVDARSESVGRKIRDAELKKAPYVLIVGDDEIGKGTVSVRRRVFGSQGTMELTDLIERLRQEVTNRLGQAKAWES